MVQVTENAVIKKAPAKKTPAKKMTDAERDLLLKAKRQAEESQAVAVSEREEFISSIRAVDKRTDAVVESVSKLTEQMQVMDLNNIKIVIPSELIRRQLDDIVEDHNNKLIQSINESDAMLNELHAEDVQQAMKDLLKLREIAKTVERLESDFDELPDVDDLSYRLDDLEYKFDDISDEGITEGCVNELIGEYLRDDNIQPHPEDELQELHNVIGELKSKVDRLERNKLFNRVKSLFSRVFSKLSLKRLLSPRSKR